LALFNEAMTLKKLAQRALERGERERAKEYIKRAIRNLEILELNSNDKTMLQIWRKAKENFRNFLREIDEYQSENLKLEKRNNKPLVDIFRSVKFQKKVMKDKHAKYESKKVTKHESKKTKIPEVCKLSGITVERPDLTFDKVAGFDSIKKELRESIEWQLKYPDLLKRLDLKPLKGILLYGPPGTGKTFLVKAAAGEFGIPILLADPASIMSKYVGESEKIVRSTFECARAIAPCIVFVDEIDKVLPLHTSGSDAPKRVEAQFLQEMDGVRSGEGFIMVFATNEPWNISPALIRPGRIDRIIYVGPPDDEVRKALFKIYLKNIPLEDDIDFDQLVELTKPNNEGYYSSSGITLICNEAKKILLRRWTQNNEMSPLKMEDLVKAIEKVPRNISHRMVKDYESWSLQYSTFK